VSYAYGHVSFYHRKFDELGIKPDDIRTVADLNKVPVIRRDELQKHSDELVSNDFDSAKLRVVSTSGSTGRPFFTRITPGEDDFRKVKLLRANMICGQKPRDRWVVVTAPQHAAHVSALQRFAGIYFPIAVSVFDGAAVQLSRIEKLMPDVLDGYSSSILLLAREIDRNGTKTIAPKMMIGGAELIDASSRKYVEGVLGAPFYDEYACVELERLAWQCEKKGDHHIDADSVVMQFVDENEDEVVLGETGEIVCTSLFNHAMPFIRYAVGDIGRQSEEKVCECGRVFPLMKVIEGRKEEMILLPDGRVLSPLAVGDCMSAYPRFDQIVQYRFIQKKVDLFRILIAKKTGIEDKMMETDLSSHIRRTLRIREIDATIDMEFVDEIPPDDTGKIRKVVSEIKRK
jgi:phenylacetate-CoA ligase